MTKAPEGRRWKVAVLGATGAVGQRMIQLLAHHSWFEVSAVAASERSTGKLYSDATRWLLETPIPAAVASMKVLPCSSRLEADLALSGLDAGVAGEIEHRLAEAGIPVISNARNHRMEPDVPLLVPEINAAHAEALAVQRSRRGWKSGFLATNPNCSTMGLVLALAALSARFRVKKVSVSTMQAISGAGYPGVASLDILGNIIPHISGEEEKMEAETKNILGHLGPNGFEPSGCTVSAQCHRVPVQDGHLLAVSTDLEGDPSVDAVRDAFGSYRSSIEDLELPSHPSPVIILRDEPDRPQPRLDAMAGGGMAITVGRVRPCPILGTKFNVLVHNTIRGAAGAAILNAEFLVAKGHVQAR